MHTGKSYKLSEFLDWTRRDIYVLIVLGVVAVVAYQVGNMKWLVGGTLQSGPWSGGLQLSQFTFDGFRQHSAAESRQLAAVARRTEVPHSHSAIMG